MKKILGFVLSMMFIVSMMIMPTSAANETVTISGSNETAEVGDTVTVTFSASKATFATYSVVISYDSEVLQLYGEKPIQKGSVSDGSLVPNPANGKIYYYDVYDYTTSEGESLFTVTFKVTDKAELNKTYPVSISIENVVKANQEQLGFGKADGSVTIICDHDYTSVTTPATCEGEGKIVYTCSKCGHSYTEKINPIGHSWDEGKVTTEANCTTEGVKTFTCKNDKTHTYTEKIPVNGVHSYDNGVVTTPATCDKDGVMTFTCKHDPSHTYTKSIKALGHKWDEGKVTTKPTCTENGVMTYTCLNDPSHTYTEVIPAHGHDWTDWEPLKKPTETEWGLDQRTCRICGCTETRDVAPAKDQVPDTGVRSNNYAAWIAVAAVAGVAVVTVARKRKTAK